jgi:hypothetical protein
MTTYYERILNGDFESGDEDGWTTAGVVSTVSPHAGTYSLKLTSAQTAYQILPNLLVSEVTAASLEHKGAGTTFSIIITYSDATTTTVSVTCSATWLTKDFLANLSAGKTITKIQITNGSGADLYIDDVSIQQAENADQVMIQSVHATSYILELTHTIQFEEEQEIVPSVKNVPLRAAGQVIDDDIWVEKPMVLSIIARLTTTEKATLASIFSQSVKVYITAGPWKYIGWVDKKNIRYVLSRESTTIDCDWETTMTIVVEYIQFGEVGGA